MPAKKKSSSKPGLWANIHAKQERIAHGSGETMRKPGEKGAPTAKALKKSSEKSHGTSSGKKAAPARRSRPSAK